MPKETEINVAIGNNTNIVIPQKEAMSHVAADLIMSYATDSYPVDFGPDWTNEHIKAAILKGLHPSAHVHAALQSLLDETDDWVQNGYAKVMRNREIMHTLPSKLKCSPVDMIPQKSTSYRTIFNLSFQICHRGKLMDSVKSVTVKNGTSRINDPTWTICSAPHRTLGRQL